VVLDTIFNQSKRAGTPPTLLVVVRAVLTPPVVVVLHASHRIEADTVTRTMVTDDATRYPRHRTHKQAGQATESTPPCGLAAPHDRGTRGRTGGSRQRVWGDLCSPAVRAATREWARVRSHPHGRTHAYTCSTHTHMRAVHTHACSTHTHTRRCTITTVNTHTVLPPALPRVEVLSTVQAHARLQVVPRRCLRGKPGAHVSRVAAPPHTTTQTRRT
jgi:hypothetical protein